jgi:preprotein translocase SecE subunit
MTALITRRNLLALLLAVVFACSLFTVGAFAAEETTAAAEETTVAEEVTTEAATEATTEGATTEEATTEAADDHEGHDHENEGKNFWQKNFMRKNAEGKEVLYVTKIVVWGLVIAGLIAGVVFCIVKREVAAAYLRALNSEKKRIVWSSWKETRKNTLVVLAVVAAITLVIFLFNMVLEKIFGGASTGGDLWFQKSLLELIRGLFP